MENAMSALDDLRNKKTPLTELELCVLAADSLGNSERAAEELKELQEYKKHAGMRTCVYCGDEIQKSDGMFAVLEHIATCEKRPEKAILKRAFDVNDMLIAWIEHVAGVGSPIEIKLINGGTHTIEASPHYFTDCETCKQIAEYLAQYHNANK